MNAVISRSSATRNPLHTNYLEQAADSSFRSYDYRDYRLRLGQFKLVISLAMTEREGSSGGGGNVTGELN